MPMLMSPDLFTETTVVLVVAAVVSAIGALLRQPLIVAYIITGDSEQIAQSDPS